MSRYKQVVRKLEDADVVREDLVTISEAAGFLGITIQGLSAAVDRGQMTAIIDTEAPNPTRGRRLLLWSEVHERKRARR